MKSSAQTRSDKFFYFGMTLLIAAVVSYGFGRTIDEGLIHPEAPLPSILYVHVAVFVGWIVLLLVQSGLVRAHQVALHRRLGMSGLALGAVLPLLGLATVIAMKKWESQREAVNSAALAISINDMLSFAVAFGLAVYWRRKPELHRRLMIIASCCLTVAAFARFPSYLVPKLSWYAYVDALIVLGMLRDLVMSGSIHVVYRYALPCVMAGQALAMYLLLAAPQAWVSFTGALLK